jgi:hypothetical protein
MNNIANVQKPYMLNVFSLCIRRNPDVANSPEAFSGNFKKRHFLASESQGLTV